jgi:hypothetical protein
MDGKRESKLLLLLVTALSDVRIITLKGNNYFALSPVAFAGACQSACVLVGLAVGDGTQGKVMQNVIFQQATISTLNLFLLLPAFPWDESLRTKRERERERETEREREREKKIKY